MALPTLDYSTWRFKVNQDLNTTGAALGDNRQILLAIKNSMITASGWTDSAGASATVSNPWTVVASSNSTVADLSDNWNSATDLVWSATGARSWIVLRQTGINGGNTEYCIHLNASAASTHLITTVVSPYNGFDVSSPSTTARPTASDELAYFTTDGGWLTSSSVAFNSALHVMMTSGGECTRFFAYIGNVVKSVVAFDKPKQVTTGWSNPIVLYTAYQGGVVYTVHNDTSVRSRCCISGVHVETYLSSLYYLANMFGQNLTIANEITSEWPMIPVRLFTATPAPRGFAGALPDIWWGSTGVTDGDTYPDTGTLNQFLHTGNVIVPWDQSTPLLT